MRRDERGVSVGATAAVALLMFLGLAVAGAVLVTRASHQTARRAADLAALAAAQVGVVEGCRRAEVIATANHAVVIACRVEASGLAVVQTEAETRLHLPGTPSSVTAEARAVPR